MTDALDDTRAARDLAIAEAVQARWVQALDPYGQAVADATVKALADAGWLRQAPATTAVVKRILRNDRGEIDVIVERVEQVETTP